MQKTPHFNLPLVAAAQAQKHITVNEAMARLDALVQLRLVSITQTSVPRSPTEGAAYFVPTSRTGSDAWMGLQGQIALYINGGWTGIAPKRGWQAWVESDNSRRSFNGTEWLAETGGEATSTASNGAQTQIKIYEHTHNVTNEYHNDTVAFIPSHSIVFGVTARVTQTIRASSGVRTWNLGVSGNAADNQRYGSQYGLSRNSHAVGVSGAPVTYYRNTSLRIGPPSSSQYFLGGGQIVFSVHAMKFTPPSE